MKNYGDICLINGGKVEAVDCIIGGSPCQNLSVAGNRKGLEGSESRLFLEQMRVIKEMRQATEFQKPRYMVWENVTGSLSCNKGKDFQCVLNECVETALLGKINLNKGTKDGEENITEDRDGRETGIPDVPMPKDGKWPKSGILYDDMERWSIAWRVHDAQYWGVAQRRRRIALVCDFGGMSAPEVLFESHRVQRDFDTCNPQGKGVTEASVGIPEESDKIWDARGNGNGQLCATLTGDHDNRITDYTNVVVEKNDLPVYCIGNGQSHVTEHYTEEVSQTLNCMHDPMTILEPCAYQLVGVNSNSMKSSNPNSGCYETEQAGTITTNGCVPNNQGGTSIMEPVIPIEVNGCRESHKDDWWSTEQVSYTLNTVERYGVAYGETESFDESHPVVVDRAAFNQGKNAQFDIKIEETETVPSMVARGPHAVAQPVQYRGSTFNATRMYTFTRISRSLGRYR
jgi:DNA (cytosine-5)-methyltransferase 1